MTFSKKICLAFGVLAVSSSAFALTDQELGKLRVPSDNQTTQYYSNPMHPTDGTRRLDNLYRFGHMGQVSQIKAANQFCISKGALGAVEMTVGSGITNSTKTIGDNAVCTSGPLAKCIGFSGIRCVNSCKPGFADGKLDSGSNAGAYACNDQRYYKVGGQDMTLMVDEPADEVGKTKCPEGWALEYNSSNKRVVCGKELAITVPASQVDAACTEGTREPDIFTGNVDGCRFSGDKYKRIACSNGTISSQSGVDKCNIAATTTTEKRYVRVFPSSPHPNPVVGTTDKGGNEQECLLPNSRSIFTTGSTGHAYCRKLR